MNDRDRTREWHLYEISWAGTRPGATSGEWRIVHRSDVGALLAFGCFATIRLLATYATEEAAQEAMQHQEDQWCLS